MKILKYGSISIFRKNIEILKYIEIIQYYFNLKINIEIVFQYMQNIEIILNYFNISIYFNIFNNFWNIELGGISIFQYIELNYWISRLFQYISIFQYFRGILKYFNISIFSKYWNNIEICQYFNIFQYFQYFLKYWIRWYFNISIYWIKLLN